MTTFVFVHGRGQHGPDLTDWRKPIADHLVAAGVTPPRMDGPQWMELRYDDLLQDESEPGELTWPTRPAVPMSAYHAYAARNEVLRQMAVKAPTTGVFDLLGRGVEEAASLLLRRFSIPANLDAQKLTIQFMGDVNDFATDEALRVAIVHRLLEELPDGDIVLVAHSLGTVAVLEMLPYLPTTISVRLLLTLGSPAAIDRLQENTNLAGAGAPFPADRVDRWLNLVNIGDPITLGAGLEGCFSMAKDHRVRTVYSRRGELFHGVRTYLETPLVADALKFALYREQLPVLHGQHEEDERSDLLPSYVSVLYAGLLAESANEGKHRQRGRRIRDEKLLAALSEAEGRKVEMHDVDMLVGAWVAAGQPWSHRLTVLFHAATSDPLAPFDPGMSDDDRAAALRQLAQRLGLSGEDAEDILALIDSCWQVARNEKSRPPWRKWLIGTGLAATVAFAAPVALGAFAAAGAMGAAAMTSGLAALGAGSGMAGGLSTLAALSAGVGVVGGQLAGGTPTAMLQDESAMIQDLAHRSAMLRLLRALDEDDAQESARRMLDGLRLLEDDLEHLVREHETLSSSKAEPRLIAERNLARVQAVRAWISEKAAADRSRAGLPAAAGLPAREPEPPGP